MELTPDDILATLLETRVFSRARWEQVAPRRPLASLHDADELCRFLIVERLLTPFQGECARRGQGSKLVLSHYEVRDFLGRGGMGNVYLAHDRRNRRPCALKVLAEHLRDKERSLRRFQREMEVNQRLSHPGLAAAYEAGLFDGVPCLVMEYVPGRTLYRLVRAEGPVAGYWACKWVAEVAHALDYAHQSGVIHRDLKPSNVIITPPGSAKLLDLGLARWYADDHNEHQVVGENRIVGSFDYMAPEQAINSARADARSDIYGLGCLLYFALSGRPPFSHVGEQREKIAHHREVDAEPLAALRRDLPTGLVKMVDRMMAKSPADRFQVAAEVAEKMDRWADRLRPEGPLVPPGAATAHAEDEAASTEDPIALDDPTGDDDLPTDSSSSADGSGFWSRARRRLSDWLGSTKRSPS